MLRGDCTLLSLRQKILCICDSVVELEDGKELEPIDQTKTHMVLYPSSFIFIHDTFYIDYSMPNSQDISVPIREFMARKKCFDPVTSRDIEGVKIIDLKLRLGQPYVFQHSGTCEHLLIFHDLRLMERTDELVRYPMVVYEKKGDVRCSACKRGYAAFVVEECERLPSPYMMFCDPCFREFFFLHGHKIGRFRAHPYMPINRFVDLFTEDSLGSSPEKPIMITSRFPRAVACTSRSISTTAAVWDRYDPRLFRDPITDIKEMHQPLDENDERNFLFLKAMKSDDTPVFYRDHTVDKLTRVIMNSGRKETARHHVYAALEIIKRRQYKAWLKAKNDEEKGGGYLIFVQMSLAGMAATTLAEFEQQYSMQTAEVTATIARLPSLPASDRPASVQSVQRVLTDVADLLEQMELAVRDLAAGSAERNKYELRVRSYRNDKRLLDGELEKAIKRLRESADREELLAYDEAVEMDQQEEQLIANTERLERSSRKIQDAYRMAVETEQIGAEVLGNLSSQRETISRARERMREADVELGRSNRLLNTMIRRVIQNRLLLLVVAILLMFSLLFLVYKSL
ncbi:vesicle transport v-SNARE protein [Ancylostoma caninum]|nr:vesicle transport v-SNARE protein [Ancylostoma caninum]